MMEPLSLLRLSSPKRPHGPHIISSGYTAAVHSESGSAFSTPYTSAPSSPRRTFFFFREEVEEPPLGEVRAAVPFLWEEVPGTPRRDDQIVSVAAEAVAAAVREKDAEVYGAQLAREDDYSFEFVAGARQVEAAEDGSEDVSGELSVDSESDSGFEFTARRFADITTTGAAELAQAGNSILQSINTTTTPHCNMSTADELFFKGRVLPLRLPPRLLQSPKQQQLLQTISDSSCSSSFDDSSSAGSSVAKSSDLSSGGRRMRSSKSRLLIFLGCGQPNEEEAGADVETLMLQGIEESDTATCEDERSGQYERRRTSPPRGSLSPLRLFKNQANSRSDEEVAEAILDLSFSDYSSSAVEKTSLEGLKLDPWPQYKEKTSRQGKLRELLEYHRQPDRANTVESPNKELLHGNVSLLASPANQGVLPSLPGIAEIDMKNSVMKHDEDSASVMSCKDSTERSNSRLWTSSRNPLLPRKLRSSSSSSRSAMSSDLHVRSFPLHQIRRTLFRGCLGSTPTTDEQEFADIYKNPSPGLRSQKVL